MAQKYRIYINDNTLFVTDSVPQVMEKIQRLELQDFDLPKFSRSLGKTSQKKYVLVSKEPKQLFEKIKKQCALIKAAGGLAESGKGKYLVIFRNQKWDLPKGKLERAESMKVGAVREVEEECGVKIEERQQKICTTYHVYFQNARLVMKKTNWYKMKVKGEPKLNPQLAEGITKAVWLKREELPDILTNTFPSIKHVLESAKLVESLKLVNKPMFL